MSNPYVAPTLDAPIPTDLRPPVAVRIAGWIWIFAAVTLTAALIESAVSRAAPATSSTAGTHPAQSGAISILVILATGVRAVRGRSRGMALSGSVSLAYGVVCIVTALRVVRPSTPMLYVARTIAFSIGFVTAGMLALISIRPYARWRAAHPKPRGSV